MKKICSVLGAFALVTCALPGSARANNITYCPDPQDSTRQYNIELADADGFAVCFAYGDGNLNGASNDAFLEIYPDLDFIGQNDAFDSGGSTFTGDFGTFLIDNFQSDLQYYIGVKDGGDPKWAVFALPVGVDSGWWSVDSPQGALSHLALYSGGTEPTGPEPTSSNLPEPATLTLLGSGLAFAAARLRRRKA